MKAAGAADAPAEGGNGEGGGAISYFTLFRNAPWRHRVFICVVMLQILCILTERLWLFSISDFSSDATTRASAWFLAVILLSLGFVG
jgi:hypothetical protein